MSAGDWIKMRTNLADDPRVLSIATACKIRDVDLVVGKLQRIWSAADSHSVDGVLQHATVETIDRMLKVRGFAAAMATVGWLQFEDKGAIIPRFHEHNGASAKRRAMEARRKAKGRDGGAESPQHVRKPSATDADEKREVAELESEGDLNPPSPPLQKRGRGRSKRPTSPFPEGLTLSAEMAAYAVGKKIDPNRPPAMFDEFKAHHEAKGSEFVDWTAAWRTWVHNEVKFHPPATPEPPLPYFWACSNPNHRGGHSSPNGIPPDRRCPDSEPEVAHG